MKKHAVTIHDIAGHLSVSATTVWRALNDTDRVSQQTRARVLEAAKQFNYRPSLVAQTLAKGRTQTCGILVPDIGNPVYASLVRAIEQVAFENGYNIMLCDTDFALDREREYVDLLIRRRVDGVIVLPFAKRRRGDYSHLLSMLDNRIKLVAMQQRLPSTRIDQVMPDNRSGARALTEHLIRLGHRRIAFVHCGVPRWYTAMQERLEGYLAALDASGITHDPNLVVQIGEFEAVISPEGIGFDESRLLQLIARDNPPTAIFAPVDVLAIKVMGAIQAAGYSIPNDVAVAGFDDIMMSSYTRPSLTTVRHPCAEVGRRAAMLLLDQIKGVRTRDAPRVCERVPCQLVVRKSCGEADARIGGGFTTQNDHDFA